MATYCFDLDETLCTSINFDYAAAKPYVDRIGAVNKLFLEGNEIVIYTARGSKTGIDWEELTIAQLSSWELKYHSLEMGKPFADFYIDDKAINVADFRW
jgi:carbamoyl-phosphate synthase large subunit